jgi:N-acetylmuramoyl-L-alanine amidase
VNRTDIHDPIRIRVAEAPQQIERARDTTRIAIERTSEEEAESLVAGVPAGVPRDTVAEHLDAAGFPEERFEAESLVEGVDPLEQALATFQASVGIEPTGFATPETWDQLEESVIVADPANVAFSPPQAEGERSDAVKQTEQVLADLNLIPQKEVDGDFTEVTTRGSQAWEQENPGFGQDGSIDLAQFRAMVGDLVQQHTAKPPVVDAPSPNQSSRGGTDIDSIVLHHTASNSTEGDLATLRRPNGADSVSAHYLIGRDGTIYQLVPDDRAAWHAGESALRGVPTDMNARSIGIEITNDGLGQTPFTPEQYAALRQLVPHLVATYDIPIENIVGHKDIAPDRKIDPAANFETARVLSAVERLQELEKLA